MPRLFALRWVSVCLLLSLGACGGGGGGGSNNHTDGGDVTDIPDGSTADAGPDSGDVGPLPDGGNGQDGAVADGGGGGGGGDGGVDACTPKTECEEDDCGELSSDGCGGTINCKRACTDGKVCGLKRPDKCDLPDAVTCETKSAEEACDGKCGAVSDGCSGTITCTADNGGVTCGSGQLCGGYDGNRQDNKCVDIPLPPCTRTTCEAAGVVCGKYPDNCGGELDCTAESGGCTAGQICQKGACVTPEVNCTPTDPTVLCLGKCGSVVNNCGDAVNCETPGNGGTTCDVDEVCGAGNTCTMATQACTQTPVAMACSGLCGTVSDGCSGIYNCDINGNGGTVCNANAGETCGGSGTQNVCGSSCHAKTMVEACGTGVCGVVSDGCNGTYNCGTTACTGGAVCDFGTNQCYTPVITCTPKSEAVLCANKCGDVANGCEGVYHCSAANGGVTCSGSDWCGGSGVANTCGHPVCNPKSCGGNTCGLISNGCGGVTDCWADSSKKCSGENEACILKDSVLQCVAGGPSCDGALCDHLPTGCSPGSTTKLTGTVKTPGYNDNGTIRNQLPVPNAIVYIPSDTVSGVLPDIFEGVDSTKPTLSCGRCSDEKLVNDGYTVLAAGVTDYKGDFTLEGLIPTGVSFNLVVKVGKWRRVISVPSSAVSSCNTAALDASYTRLPAFSGDGDSGTHLPRIAISTGKVDQMECVFRGIGIADSEFTLPNAGGRVDMYRANGAYLDASCTGTYTQTNANCTGKNQTTCNNTAGCTYTGGSCKGVVQCSANSAAGCKNSNSGCSWSNTNADSNLFNSSPTLGNYDLIVWDCEGSEIFEQTSARGNVESYVNAGGRMFASHYSYTWIENKSGTGSTAYNGTLAQSADWGADGSADSATGYVSMTSGTTSRPRANAVKSVLMKNWLDWQGALTGTNPGVLDNPTTPQFTIADPRDRAGKNVGASTDEWVYRTVSADHCSNDSSRSCTSASGCTVCSNDSTKFCSSASDCGLYCSNDHSKACTSKSDCGSGFTVKCNYSPNTCGGTATCDPGPRVQQLSFNTPYGKSEDEICGRVAYSGFHVANASDNSALTFPGICATGRDLNAQEKILAFMLFDLATCVSAGDPPAPPSCTPKTAEQVCPNENDACGYLSDGCGGIVDCGGCDPGYFCSGNTCTEQQCVPTTCAQLGYNCGQHSDGCGGFARDTQGNSNCGTCAGNQVCGLGGPGLCGSPSCTPIPSATACSGKNCGQVSNGCGGTYNCGSCTNGEACGGSGTANVCGAGSCSAIPKETACSGKNCGQVSDGCGGSYDCGSCTAPASCGGGGNANICGTSSCVPVDKSGACSGAECGYVSNGCSGVWDCGTCPNGGICGGAGPNKCGAACDKTSCGEAGAECGAISDDCGGIIECGSCPSGKICGAQEPNKCGTGVSCTARSCASVGAQCGTIGDGCGGVKDCGTCTAPETCGGAGTPNHCGIGTGGCNKLTCSGQNVACGPTSDGCGGVLDCGGCPIGYECKASKCELLPPILY